MRRLLVVRCGRSQLFVRFLCFDRMKDSLPLLTSPLFPSSYTARLQLEHPLLSQMKLIPENTTLLLSQVDKFQF